MPSMKNSSDLKSETSQPPVAVASNATVPATLVPSQSMASFFIITFTVFVLMLWFTVRYTSILVLIIPFSCVLCYRTWFAWSSC